VYLQNVFLLKTFGKKGFVRQKLLDDCYFIGVFNLFMKNTFQKAILTGLNGTIGPVLAKRLQKENIEVLGWDRKTVPVDDAARGDEFVTREAPDLVVHLAMGDPSWAGHLAALAAKRGIRFLYISSVSVFDGSQSGPFSPDKVPDATDDYGRYKAECERRVRESNSNACIARLGWQIGDRSGSNNMVDFLSRQHDNDGTIAASARWFPSCAFLEDTVDGLWNLISECEPAIYHLEGNDGCSFFEIVTGLNRILHCNWSITETSDPATDIRMLDQRIKLKPVSRRFRCGEERLMRSY